MIIFGIAATPDADLDGHVLLSGAVNCARRVPLCIEHQRAVGSVIHLCYAGSALYVTAETDDADALRLGHFSVAGRAIEREQRADGLWNVTKFRLTEISLVRSPVNANCVVRERSTHDPLRELAKARSLQFDLFAKSFDVLARGLRLVAT